MDEDHFHFQTKTHQCKPILRLVLRGLGLFHATASRVSHISECNRCKLVGVFDLTAQRRTKRAIESSRLLRTLSNRSRGCQTPIAASSQTHLSAAGLLAH